MGLSCSFKETRTLIEITFSVMSFETFRLQNRGNRIITFSMLPSMDLRKKKDIQRIYMSEEQRSLLCFKKMVGKVWVGIQTKHTLSIVSFGYKGGEHCLKSRYLRWYFLDSFNCNWLYSLKQTKI